MEASVGPLLTIIAGIWIMVSLVITLVFWAAVHAGSERRKLSECSRKVEKATESGRVRYGSQETVSSKKTADSSWEAAVI